LSDIELAILRALADGLHSKEIALQVRRSKPTVEGYVRQLCIKFDARSRAQLVAKAFGEGALQYRLGHDAQG
jgi:DNA-binding NarL/FixJ family response regulator